MRHAVRRGGVLSQSLDLVLLVGFEVSFKPVPRCGVLIGTLPRENVRGNAVKEPTIVGDHHCTTRELQESILQ